MQRQLVLLLLLAPLGAFACSRPASDHVMGANGPVVVTFGNHQLTASEIQKELGQQSPFIRSRYQSLEKKKEFVDGIVRLDLLADEATKAGWDKDPDVQHEYKKAMVQKWMREKFNDKEGMASIPETDLHAYYDAHKDEYQRPERLRLQLIFFKGNTPSVRAEAEKALKLVALRVAKNDPSAFAELARNRSDDVASKVRGGDLDFHIHDELAKLYGEPVAAGADALKSPNDLSPLLAGLDGLYALRLEARQPAFNRTFDQVKATLQARLWNERRNTSFEAYVKELRDKANVKIDETELAKLDAMRPDMNANSAPAPMIQQPPPVSGAQPMPGFPTRPLPVTLQSVPAKPPVPAKAVP